MTEILNMEETFDKIVVSITESLSGLTLSRVESVSASLLRMCRIIIHTRGQFEACMVCEAEPSLLQYIITQMHGGSPPDPEEAVLYMNEYMNIVCGRAVSAVNNATGNSSRLSVPVFYAQEEEFPGTDKKEQEEELCYQSAKGSMRFKVSYTLH